MCEHDDHLSLLHAQDEDEDWEQWRQAYETWQIEQAAQD